MRAPLYSTVTLVAELFVSAAIYYSIALGWRKNIFKKSLVAFALAYEVLFNISYMAYRAMTHVDDSKDTKFEIGLAIFHGTLSLAMFLALIVFMIAAWRAYGKGRNFFKAHPKLTWTFLTLWTISILSGVVFYAVEYLF